MPKNTKEQRQLAAANIRLEQVRTYTSEAVDEYFGELEPDEHRAYVVCRVCKALPKIIGPESMRGNYFGMHPQVLYNSMHSLLHQQTNMAHKTILNGHRHDTHNGCILGVAMPKMPSGGWQITSTEEEAPSLTVLAVLWKKAAGVSRMLGGHVTSNPPMSLSIEVLSSPDSYGVFDPLDNSVMPLEQFRQTDGASAISRARDGGLVAGRYEDRQLALALGGVDGQVRFYGYGYTPNPAEDTAHIDRLTAERSDTDACHVMRASLPEWLAGMDVTYSHPLLAARRQASVVEVISSGCRLAAGGQVLTATAENPILRLRTRRGDSFLRHADGCRIK